MHHYKYQQQQQQQQLAAHFVITVSCHLSATRAIVQLIIVSPPLLHASLLCWPFIV